MIRDSKILQAYVCGLMDAMPDASFMVDSAGQYCACQCTGCKNVRLQERGIARKIDKYANSGSLPRRARRPLRRILYTTTDRAMDAGLSLRALCKDGAELPVEISLSPIETDQDIFVIGAG